MAKAAKTPAKAEVTKATPVKATPKVVSKAVPGGKVVKNAPVNGAVKKQGTAAEAAKTKREALRHPTYAKKIKVLVDKNPKRAGSASAARFDLYKTSATVADYVDKGGQYDDIKWDVDHKYISLS